MAVERLAGDAQLGALLGTAAMLAGPISAIVLMMELTGYSRAAVISLVIAVATATLAARTIGRAQSMTPA